VAKRYQPQALIGEQGGVQTFAGRDALNGLPVRMYTFMGEPTARVGELGSPYIPPVLSSTFLGGAGEVIVAFSPEFRPLKGTVAPGQVEALLRQSAAALDDAARAGVVHGDLSPERVLFDREAGQGGRFLLEGYGVPWRVKPSEFSAPERIGGASFAADIFSWARTVTHLSGPLPGDLRDLLARCLDADPAARPHAREVRAALDSYPFGTRGSQPGPGAQAARDVSAFDHFSGDDEDVPDEADDFSADAFGESDAGDSGDFGGGDFGEGNFTDPTPGTPKRERIVRVQPAPPDGAAQALEPTPSQKAGAVWIVPRTTESRTTGLYPAESRTTEAPGLPADSLRQIDETTAYRARRARYEAERGSGVSPSQAVQVKPLSDATGLEKSMPEKRAAVRPAPDRLTLDNPAPYRSAPDNRDEEDFEVVDDINDRAPDPTLHRGGRRVLLLTLLVIAILVLLALQFI